MQRDIHEQQIIEKQISLGLGWSGFAQVSKQLVQFFTLAVLARLLTPDDFGRMGLILIFIEFLAIFGGEIGFSEALVQKFDISESHLSTVFWLSLFAGICSSVLMYLGASSISWFYAQPDLIIYIHTLAIIFPITSLKTVQYALLRREMNFRMLGLVELYAISAAGVIAVVLAFSGYGIWSLIWRNIVNKFVLLLFMWYTVDWRPKFIFQWKAVGEIWKYSVNILGFGTLDYWTRRADNLVIGKFLGTYSLGLYTQAYTMMLLAYQLGLVIQQVMFPALSRLQKDKAHSKILYLRTLSGLALCIMPILSGLAVIAPIFVMVAYGEQWLEISAVLRILCIVGLFLILGSTVNSIYLSQNRTDIMLKWSLVTGIGAISSFLVGIWMGTIEDVAISYAVFLIFISYWQYTIPGKLIDMTIIDIIKSINVIIYCNIIMIIVLYITSFLLVGFIPIIQLLIFVSIGIASYVCMLEISKEPTYLIIRKMFRTISISAINS